MGMALPAAILGGTGLLGGLYSAKVAQENNEDQIDFAQWSQLNSQEFNAAMYDKAVKDQREMYEKYQSPQAIAQSLRAAGLNPSAMGGSLQGGSIPSVPSTPHSSPVGTPQLQNEGSAFAQSLQSIGSAFSSLASAELQDAQTNESRTLLNEKLNQLILQNNGQQLMNAKTQFDTYAAQQKLPHEINDIINDCYLKYYQGKHSEALVALTNMQEKIAQNEYKITSEQAVNIAAMIAGQLSLLTENANLVKAQQKTESSKQAANYGSASYSNALAATENALRPYRTQIERAHGYVEQATSRAKIKQVEADLSKSEWFNEILKNQNIGIVLENMDKKAYNSLQRILRGKSVEGDVINVVRALSAPEEYQFLK